MGGVRRVTRRFVAGIRDLSREIDERATRIVQEERAKRLLEEYNVLRRFSQGEDLAMLHEKETLE